MRLLAIALVAIAACGVDTSSLSKPDLSSRDAPVQPKECMNGFTDGEETDLDCGGPTCLPCDAGKACKVARDCVSMLCTNGKCDAPSCMDGVKNGTESDQDCGGTCAGCPVGKMCNAASDCQGMTCTNGVCAALGQCMNGRQDGAETDLDCGGGTCPSCDNGKMCLEGTDCKSGACSNNVCKSPLMCMAGTADCDGSGGNGCEVNTNTDAKNCGACGKACPVLHATATCTAGVCGLGSCDPGFADCNQNGKDGCEGDLMQDPVNCGSCGMLCAIPVHASPGCAGGVCGLGPCDALYGNCDGMAKNGCETSLAANLVHCGQCGKPCKPANATGDCRNGSCEIMACNAGFADCDKSAATGCEVATGIDAKNCGGCGIACPAQKRCLNGACGDFFDLLVITNALNDSTVIELLNRLKQTNAFISVTAFDATNATPPVQQMKVYGAILVMPDRQNFGDPVRVGDNLADYFDAGGNVVVAMFAFAPEQQWLQGRFIRDGYSLIGQAKTHKSDGSQLGVVAEPQSPLMAGVNTLIAGNAFRSPSVPQNGGIVVASWKDGAPLIVRGVIKGRNRVDLNMYPAPDPGYRGSWTGDGATILKNALLYK